jgi:hypothetical protein
MAKIRKEFPLGDMAMLIDNGRAQTAGNLDRDPVALSVVRADAASQTAATPAAEHKVSDERSPNLGATSSEVADPAEMSPKAPVLAALTGGEHVPSEGFTPPPAREPSPLGAATPAATSTKMRPSRATPIRAAAETVAPEPAPTPTGTQKKKLTLDLTEDTVRALYSYQANLRQEPGAKASQTTVGWVADKLLRLQLGLPPATRAVSLAVQESDS